ncbi:MAG: T9SS type A sorting domain-containing protein [Melioribacteraceae bacterium]|nr:T9SS type A sorting domain-containing protein [Melioribacteraceae bacterium]
MKKILLILIITAQIIHSQNISGKLVDHNGDGLSEAELKLYIEPDVYNTTSESDGSFTFVITSVKEDQLPKGYAVSNNYPNPFNPKTRIEVTLANSGNVKLEVYNILGQLVTDVIDKKMNAGTHFMDLELAGNSNGVYIAKTTIDNKYSVINKMLLLYGSQHLITNSFNQTNNFFIPKQVMSSLSNLSIDSLVIESKIIEDMSIRTYPNLLTNHWIWEVLILRDFAAICRR